MRKFLVGFLMSVVMIFSSVADDTPCGVGTEPLVPDAYTPLEYIESTGIQWIDTGYYANNNTEWTVKTKGAPRFGYINGTSGTIACNYITSSQWAWYSYRTHGYIFDNNSIYIITVKNKQLFINDELIDTQSANVPDVWQSPYTFALFGNRRSATQIATDATNIIYRFTIKENDITIRDFVPVKRNHDGAIGMYDRVSRTFFENAGTGEFIAGPEVGILCSTCLDGYYNSVGNDTACVACPAGYNAPSGDNATDHDEISDCKITCPAGKYVAVANGECVSVPFGYYVPNEHSVNYGQTSFDVDGILQCPDGQTSSFDGTFCRDVCGVGTEHNPNFIPLPDGYTQLEYIESTGTQYIDTGFINNGIEHIKYNIDFQFTALKAAGGLWGPLDSTRSGTIWITPSQFAISAGATSSASSSVKIIADTNRHHGIVDINYISGTSDYTFTLDDVSYVGRFSSSSYYSGNSILLFRSSVDTFKSVFARVYSFKVYNDDTLVRDFIPAKRNRDGAIGMYDTVTQTFFENSGTGEFIAGPVTLMCPRCRVGYYNSVGNDTACVACPTGLVSPMGSDEVSDCGRKFHIGEHVLFTRSSKQTVPALNFDFDGDGVADFFLNATTTRTHMTAASSHYLHVGDYYIYDDTVSPGE